jgi:hypothetical protein
MWIRRSDVLAPLGKLASKMAKLIKSRCGGRILYDNDAVHDVTMYMIGLR